MDSIHFIKTVLEYTVLIPTVHADSGGVGAVAATLGINWKLLLAQLINFAIVLFILWKWVFTPLSQKLSERTARIEKSLKEADDINKMHRDAETEKAELIRSARQEASAIITASEASANKVKEEIIAEAKVQSQKIAEDAKKDLAAKQEAMLQAVRAEAAILVVAATEKILAEKLDSASDKALIKRSLADLMKENV